MLIVPADLPHMPQQVIERDVSMFQLASTKLPKIKDLPQMISTNKITFGPFGGRYSHIAYYKKSGAIKKDPMVVTIINDPSGTFQNNTQIIFYGNEPVRESNTWQWEVMNGIRYMRHKHKDFFVYSTDYEQHIVKR